MNRKILALACILPLAGCGGTIAGISTSGVASCVAGLPLFGNPSLGDILAAAKTSPACRELAQDALEAAVREAMLRMTATR